MTDFLMVIKRLADAALDLYAPAQRVHVSVAKHDLRDIVEDWRRLDSAYRTERLNAISLKSEIESLRKEADQLHHECARFRKDAERYRFIRSQGEQVIDVAAIRLIRTTGMMTVISGEVLDSQIDLLMDGSDD